MIYFVILIWTVILADVVATSAALQRYTRMTEYCWVGFIAIEISNLEGGMYETAQMLFLVLLVYSVTKSLRVPQLKRKYKIE